MMNDQPEPRLDQWYLDSEDRTFKVVALNEADQTIEIQLYDGAVEELDRDSWYDLDVQFTDEPEDWSAPFDDLEADDIEEADSAMHTRHWGNPLDEMDTKNR